MDWGRSPNILKFTGLSVCMGTDWFIFIKWGWLIDRGSYKLCLMGGYYWGFDWK